MRKILHSLKIIAGFFVAILGVIGFFIPLPFVPLFLLIFVGLHIAEKDHWIEAIKNKIKKIIHRD
jgi:uncharacterized membrane protein YbaN (DUF454 family)